MFSEQKVYNSFFKGKYSVEHSLFKGRDFSKKVLLFAGQGSADKRHIVSNYHASKIARSYFKKADSILEVMYGISLVNYVLGAEEYSYAQKSKLQSISLFVTQCSRFKHLQSIGFNFSATTALSFGEYAALFAIGCISFETTLKIVTEGELACPPPDELGHMIALRGAFQKVASALSEVEFYLSNANTHDTFVISCSSGNLNLVLQKLRSSGLAPYLLTNVHQPYHSPLMNSVQSKLSEYIEKENINIKSPSITHFSGVLNKYITSKNFAPEDVKSILLQQVVAPVNFPKQLLQVSKDGFSTFVEVGPGDYCLSSVTKILKKDSYQTIDIQKTKDFALDEDIIPEKTKDSIFLGIIGSTFERLTGYKISLSEFGKSFQDDFGLDSLKRSEVVFEVMKESKKHLNVSFSENIAAVDLRVINDLVSLLEKEHVPDDHYSGASREGPSQKFLPYREEDISFIPKRTEGARSKLLTVTMLEILSVPGISLSRVADFLLRHEENGCEKWINFSLGNMAAEQAAPEKCLSIISFWQQVLQKVRSRKIYLVLSSSILPTQKKASNILFHSFSTFFKSLGKELPLFQFKGLLSDIETSEYLLDLVATSSCSEQTFFLKDTFYKPSIVKIKSQIDDKAPAPPRRVVVIGGLGGIAKSLLLNKAFPRETLLFILGRGDCSDPSVQRGMANYRSQYDLAEYYSTDASVNKSLVKTLSTISANFGKIDLLINSAGFEKSGLFTDRPWHEVEEIFNSKATVSYNILGACKEVPISRLISFSSIVGIFGNKGQSIYSLANSYLNSVSSEINDLTTTVAQVIHWPAWKDTGMTSSSAVKFILNQSKVDLMTATEGAHYFKQVLEDKSLLEVMLAIPKDISRLGKAEQG